MGLNKYGAEHRASGQIDGPVGAGQGVRKISGFTATLVSIRLHHGRHRLSGAQPNAAEPVPYDRSTALLASDPPDFYPPPYGHSHRPCVVL